MCAAPPPPPRRFDVQIEPGVIESVSLTAEADVAPAAASLATKHGLEPEDAAILEAHLLSEFIDGEAPPAYAGPTPAEGQPLQGVVCSIELVESGLVLEVADSLLGDGAGRGLFIRTMEDVDSVTLPAGTAVCGYATGSMEASADSEGGKTVRFALREPQTSVFFEKELHTVASCLSPTRRDEAGAAAAPVESIAGHRVTRGAAGGEVEAIEADAAWEGARFFVPSEAQGSLGILNIGQFANDLAAVLPSRAAPPAADGLDAYAEASAGQNVLVLIQRLERSAERPSELVPSRPVTALSRAVTFTNTAPMELGCEYGETYWRNAAAM